MQIAATFVSGLLFGLGLCVSGLANPAKVQSFLDVTGTWDPSLLITMAAAVLITGVGYRIAFARERPLFDKAFQLPPAGAVDARLLVGATTFGVGWGLVGFCPGPAVAALSLGAPSAFVFVAAMLAGMALTRQLTADRAAPAPTNARQANS
jgi:uncharacterized membrane protein YedE/YeeE